MCAQRSLPQAGSGVGDSGPYSSDNWAEYLMRTYTGDQQATQGPLLGCLNELAVSHSAALNMAIETGAGFCYGHFLISDAQVIIGTQTNLGNPNRTDRVIMCQNNSNANYDGTVDYGVACVTPVVPRNSCRLAILIGDTATGNARALQTGPNAYMVDLARFTISTTNVISNVTDYRDFCSFSSEVLDNAVSTASIQAGAVTPAKIADRERSFFVQATYGYNNTDGQMTSYLGGLGWTLTDAKDVTTMGQFLVPSDFSSGMTVQAVVRPGAASGNIYAQNFIIYAQCAEVYSTHSAGLGYAAVAVTGTQYNNCILSTSLGSATAGDIASLYFTRNAVVAADTLNNVAYMPGWIVTYTADS